MISEPDEFVNRQDLVLCHRIEDYKIDLFHNPLCLEKLEIFLQVFRNCLQFPIPQMSRLEESWRKRGIKTFEKRTILPAEWGNARDLI